MAGAVLSYHTCVRLQRLGPERRHKIVNGATSRAAHARLFERNPALNRLELGPPPAPAPLPNPARIAFWNAERCKHPGPSAALLRRAGADAILLCEMDMGMARTGQVHTTRDLAERLKQGYVFAVEFRELGLGNEIEQARHAGAQNRDGLHGAGILAPCPLQRPVLMRLEADGAWFDGKNGERRIGGRIAIATMVEIAGVAIALVSVHLESHGDPVQRAGQMRDLIEAVDAYAGDAPVLIGGDFNTKSVPRDQFWDPDKRRDAMAADPLRLIDPVPHEPLFEVAAGAGYDWVACNRPGPTERLLPHEPRAPLARLDWFFCRGLAAADPEIHPAVDAEGGAISDHDLLVVTISPETPDEVRHI